MARLRSRQGAAKAPSSSPPKKNVAVDDSFSSDAVAPVSPDEQTQSKATFSKYSKTPPQPKGENKIRFSFTPVVASASPDKPEEVAKLRCVLFDANYADTSLLNESTATGSGEDDEEDGDGSDRADGDDEEDDDAFERSSALHTAPAPSAGPAPAAATSTGGSEAMRVYLRMRPPLEGEQTSSDGTGVTIVNDSTIEARCPKGSQAARQAGVGSASTYSFSRVCDQDTTQQELFDTTVLPLLDDAVQYGHDGLVFTYGVTGAGKTHTMQGTPTDGGLLPRSLDLLFNGIAHLQPTSPRCRPLRHHEVAVLTSRQSSQLAAQRARVLAVVTDDLLHSHNNSLLSTTSLDAPTGETILIDDDPPLPTTTTTTSDTIVPPPPAATTTSTSEDSTAAMIRTLFEQERRDAATRVCDPRAVATGSLHNPPPQQDHTATTTTTTTTTSHEFSIWMSYCEIYNELIYDLLVAPPRNTHDRRTPLKLAEDREHNVYIKGLTEVCVDTADEAWALVRIGQLNRRVADTVLNKQSSRSHCVVSVRIVRTPAHSADLTDRQLVAQSRVSSLSFVDLAGSERQSKTNATGQRLKESSNINTSLLTLGKCMDALRRNQRKKMKLKHKSTGKSLAHSQSIVPYRESKLTRLFSNIFSGSGRALMVVNVSPSLSEFDETVHALKFSAVAKQVRTLTEVPSKVQHSRTVASAVAAVAVAPPPEVNAQLLATLELMQQKLLENEQRLASMEADIREEVAAEMAQQLAELENNFHSCMDDEQAATEATMDLRMDIVTKSAKKAIKQAHAQRWCSSSASELSALTPSTPVTSGITTSAPSTTPMSRRRVSSPGRRLALEAMRGALDAQQRAVLELTETANRYKAETSQLQEQVSALEVEMEQERAQIARERDEHEQGWGEERALLEASVQRAQAEVMRLSDYVERAQAAETACRAHEETIAALERRLFELEDKREQESQDKETVEVLKQELQAQQERAKVFEADYARLRDCVHKTAMAVASEREATSRRNEQMNVQLERERQALRDCMAKLEQLQREKSLATDKEERRRSAVKRNVSAMSEEGDALEMEMRSHDEGENQPGQDDAEEGRVKKRARTNVDDQQSSLPPAKTVVRARKGLTRSSSSTGSGGSRVRRVRGSASAAVTEVVEQTGVAARVESYKRAIADGPVKMKRKERDDDDNIEAEPNENGTDDSLERALGGATTKNVIDVTLQRTTKKKHQQEQEQSQSHTTEETKLPSSPVRSALASRLKNSPVVKKLRMRLGRRTATAESTADITDAAPPPAVGRVRELRSRKVPLRF